VEFADRMTRGGGAVVDGQLLDGRDAGHDERNLDD
jgi:hypothetical protein